jgi:iron complex outermembrane receptor protein
MNAIRSKKTVSALAFSALFIGAGCSTTSWAQSDQVVMTLGEVMVNAHGGALSPRQVLTSVNVLTADRIQDQTHYSNYELISQVPGVMLGEYAGKGVGFGTVSMRGFNGEGVLNAVKLLIDGVPSNANDGNTYYIDIVPRLDIEAVEVVKGTNDPRYGLHNIAGNINIVTRSGGNYSESKLTAGSFGTQILQLAKGIEADNVTQNYALSRKTTNGFRQHMEADATNFSGKWFAKSGEGSSRIGLIVKHLSNSANEPGYLSQTQISTDPWGVASNSVNDRDTRQASQLAVQAESTLDTATQLQGQVYWNHLHDDRFIKFPDSTRQEFRQLQEQHVGASVNFTRQVGQTRFGETTLMGGIDTERQDNLNFRERPIQMGLVSVMPRRNHQYLFNTVGGFVQAILRLSDQWTVTPAYRVDKVTGGGVISYDTNATFIGTWPINHYGLIKQPKISSSYKVSEASTVYGNWGRSFQVGTGRAAYQTTAFEVGPSINEGWEIGLKFKPSSLVDARLAAWKQTAQNEARTLLANPSNDTVNLGQTVRAGTDIELNAKPSYSTTMWAGISFQKSEIMVTGKEVDHVPRRVYTLGINEKFNDKWRAGAMVTGQSSYFIDTTNPEKIGAHTLVNTSLGYRINATTDVDFQIRNLTNRTYYYSYDNVYAGSPGNFYALNMPRSAFMTISLKL